MHGEEIKSGHFFFFSSPGSSKFIRRDCLCDKISFCPVGKAKSKAALSADPVDTAYSFRKTRLVLGIGFF